MTETRRPEAKPPDVRQDASRSNPAAALREGKPPEQLKVGPMQAEVAKSSWEKPGTFAVTRDGHARTQRVEGWLSLHQDSRASGDKKLSREVGKEANRPSPNDGCHLIAHSLGGPRVESHGAKDARANLIPGDRRMNISYLGNYEAALRDYMKNNPDKRLYMQADVKYGASGEAIGVTHRVFERDKSGKVGKHALFEAHTQLQNRPSDTAGGAVKRETGAKAAEFYTPTRKGTAGRPQ